MILSAAPLISTAASLTSGHHQPPLMAPGDTLRLVSPVKVPVASTAFRPMVSHAAPGLVSSHVPVFSHHVSPHVSNYSHVSHVGLPGEYTIDQSEASILTIDQSQLCRCRSVCPPCPPSSPPTSPDPASSPSHTPSHTCQVCPRSRAS